MEPFLVFLSILVITIGATKTREEFRGRSTRTRTPLGNMYIWRVYSVKLIRASVCKYLNGKRAFNEGKYPCGRKKQRKYIDLPFLFFVF